MRRRRRPIHLANKPTLTNKVKALFRSRRFRKRLLVASLLFGLFLLLLPVLTYAYYARDINNPERLMNRNNTGVTLLDRNGQVFYTFGHTATKHDIPLNAISDNLEHALIATEDEKFYQHSGYSVAGIGRALYGNILSRDATRYGGSTITQQLVKNKLLSSNKNVFRKYQELSLAIAIDRQYSKDEILQMYLNSVYFGEGAFGIGQASKAYFNKAPADLSLAEASMLIGILPAPSAYSPISGDADAAKKQQTHVLNRLAQTGHISEAEKDAALQEQLTYADPAAATAVEQHAPHFAQMILEELNEKYGEERVNRSGFTVTTGLDLSWQKAAEAQVATRVAQLSRQGGTNAGLVAIDPHTGEIRALVGSANWDDPNFGKVNMALASRQPGSSFKPIYFAEALDKHLITPATLLNDSPRTFGTYKPENYDFRYMGKISTRRALAQSRNLTAIEVMEKLGTTNAGNAANRMGITINDPDSHGLALALGTAEARLLDMTNAYAAFGNGGLQYKPVSIVSIQNKFGGEVFHNRQREKRVQSSGASYLISSILADPAARAPGFSSLTFWNRPVAVKTGTTNDNHDAWTIGYTPSIAVGVWVGNNENRAMSGVAGGSGAGPVWKSAIQTMLADSTVEQFKRPSSVTKIRICDTAGVREEYFIRGTGPSQACSTKQNQDANKKREEEPAEQDKPQVKPPTKPTTPPPVTPPSGPTDDDDDEPVTPPPSGGTGTGTTPPPITPPPPTPITPTTP
ncbi:MAG TPA: PBP1A family penicillin-binding protein [Candidatus Saccharimonadales bacterium]|nr:PBP1A family penicillin-binding protein [Candidatus Saccharimonadales bacterium]